MPDLAIAVSDRPVAPGQYRYVETHAWWLGTFGPHQHLTEHRLRQWVPVRPECDWMLERELTGAQRWLTGSAAQAREDGFDLRDVAPVGRFLARHGDFRAAERGEQLDLHHDELGDVPGLEPGTSCAPPRPPRRGSWQAPTTEFFDRLPHDPATLLALLREDNPGSWFGPFAAAVTSLRTGLVPAALRSALYRALIGLPAVSVVERATTLDGLECVALVHDAGHTRTELMIDPADGQFAGERDSVRSAPRCDLPVGTVISTTAVTTAVVDALGARPQR